MQDQTTRSETLESLGWREWVGLPDLGIARIKAKVDSGARTSALHAYFVEPYSDGGAPFVRFGMHPLQKNAETSVICTAPVLEQRMITDSGGHREQRFVILTSVVVGAKTLSAEMTLTNRDTMKFRMLLGRTAMRGHFLVDPNTSYLAGEPAISRTL